jgi:cellulose synthase/poly-beta-1,6-N-acetylglucosamine synthase-like glycosyltransferase
VIPAYNRADLIRETLESVFAQTYHDFEIIVVDDGSTDETPTILESYEHAAKLRVIRQTNQGEGAARNRGIGAARGGYIAFLDSDDVWRADKLERQLALFADSPGLAWVYSDAYVFDHNTRQVRYVIGQRVPQYEGHIARELLMVDFVPSPTPVVRRDVFDEVGPFDCAGHLGDPMNSGCATPGRWSRPWCTDWDMWLRIAARYPVRRDPETLAGYRIHDTMMSQYQSAMAMHQYRVATIERAVAFAPFVYGPARHRALAAQSFRMGRMLTEQRELLGARGMFLEAIRYSPGRVDAYLYLLATLLGNRVLSSLAELKRRVTLS